MVRREMAMGATEDDRPVTESEQTASAGGRIFLRPLGTPLPLGFVGLAGASFVLAGLELGWVSPMESPHVALVLVAFAAPAQLLASVLAFLARDPVVGMAVGTLATTWLVSGVILLQLPPGSVSDSLGLLLMVSGTALLIPVASGGANKLTASVVLALASARYFLTGIYELTAVSAWQTVAGVAGVVVAVAALAGALAFESESSLKRPLLPTLRLGRSAAQPSEAEPVEKAVNDARHEPGVRKYL